MKKFFMMLLLTLPFSLQAQNPDGKFVSLHVTPSWVWGDVNFQRLTSVWYPPTQASDVQTVPSYNYGVTKYPLAFGVQTTIKVPTTSFLTLSLSYSYDQKFEEDSKNNIPYKYFSEFYSINGKLQSISLTVSVYNLFSLYME